MVATQFGPSWAKTSVPAAQTTPMLNRSLMPKDHARFIRPTGEIPLSNSLIVETGSPNIAVPFRLDCVSEIVQSIVNT
jgi:hypothetical protein